MTRLSEMMATARKRLRRFGVGPDHIDDLLQDAAVRLLHYQQGRVVHKPEAFLYRVARNLAIDHARHRQMAAIDPTGDSALAQIADLAPSPAAVTEAKARLQHLERGLAELSAGTRRVLLLCRLEGLTAREIAECEGLSVAAVEKRIARATCHLLQWMETW